MESDRDFFESLEEKIRRLTTRIEGLENDRKKEEENRMMEGSSENEDGNGKWKWDGKSWWFRVDHCGQVNSRMRRRISRAVKATSETKKWGDGLFQLKSRVEWLETEKQRTEQWSRVGGASTVQEPGVSRSSDWDGNVWGNQFM